MATTRKPGKKSGKQKKRLRTGRVFALLAMAALVFVLAVYGAVSLVPSLAPVISQITNNEKTAPLATLNHEQEVQEIKKKNALDQVDVTGFSDSELRECFFSSDLDDKLIERLKKMGYTDQIPAGSLKYVRVLYQDFEGNPTVGELVVNAEVAQAIENVFFDLFLHKYQIGKMILPDAYGTRISESYADNNTVALCFGLTEDNYSDLHARGYAVDLNPLYNPLIKDNGTSLSVFPMEGQLYLDRTVHAPHFIYAEDYAVQAFEKEGFVWKGNVRGLNDYKHFEYSKAPASRTPASSAASSSTASEQQSTHPETAPAAEQTVPSEIQAPVDQTPVSDESTAASQEPAASIEQPVESLPDASVPADQPVQDQPVQDSPDSVGQPEEPVQQDPALEQPAVEQPVEQDGTAEQPES